MKGTNLNLTLGLDIIYEDANFQINDLDKVGIVGVNGAGKTTLFKIIQRELELDSGHITIKNKSIGYLPQEIKLDDDDTTVWDYIMDARPIRKLEAELSQIYVKIATAAGEELEWMLAKMTKLQEKLEYYDCYNAESTMLSIIDSMQINSDVLDMKLMNLSGGQKSKIAFAHVLYSNSEILLLDEPTNHLDASTKDFITDYLKRYKGMVLIISHDKDFLNQIVSKILYINKTTHKITVYDGNYDVYKKKFAQAKELQERLIVQQEKEIKVLADFVQKAKQASQTNHKLKHMGQDRAAKLEKKRSELQVREKAYKRVKMNIKPENEGSKMPLKVENLTFHYPNQSRLYQNLSFVINGKERFLVVGENGVGKSTLLKLLTGTLTPDAGRIRYDAKTTVAYYAQELELLDLHKNILDNVDSSHYNERQLRTILGNFLFYGDDVFKKVGILSPGEKARVALCKILLKKANMLILDEPTNHLDPETQTIIGENFNSYEGTIIVVSHNPSFVEQIGISRMLILPSGQITSYSRDQLEYYYNLNTEEDDII